jgi:signal transduction histidine kinase
MLVEDGFIRVARIRGYEQFDPAFVQIVRSLTLEISSTANLRKMLETEKPLIVSDTSQDPDWIQIAPEYPIRSWAGAPIFIQNQVAAIFSLDKAEPGFYQPEHARHLEVYAGQVGLALQNSQLFMVTQQQAEQMAELAVLGGELNRPLTVDEVVRGIGQGAMALGKAGRAAVYLREAEDKASCAWFQGLSADYVREVTEQVRDVPGNQLFHSIDPILISDTEKLPADSLLRKLALQEQFRAVGLWPLVYEGKVVAAVGIYYESSHTWDETQKEILLSFTRQSAIAIQNTRLFSETRRRAVQQEALNKIIAEAVKAPDLPYLVERVLDLTLEAFGSEMGGLWLSGYSALRGLPASLGSAEAKMALDQGSTFSETLVIEDWQQTDRKTDPWHEIMDAYQIRASLSVPVLSGGKRIGGLAIATAAARQWLPDEITLAEAIGQQVGSAAERLDLLKQTQEQASQVQMIIDTVPEGVLLLDVNYRIILANPAARKYMPGLLGELEFDQPLSSLAGQPIANLLEVSAEQSWHELQATGDHNQIFELAAQPLEVAAEISGWVLVLRDVTEERANLARIQMQERLATVGQLAAGIAHDFNNIMAAIVVYIDLLAIDPGLNPDNREHIKIIQQQIQRATSLIRQILDFSRRSIMEPSPIDLLPFVKELDKLLGRILPENILLRLSYSPGTYMIQADPTSLQQVFMNLALNARDALPAGGVLQFAVTRLCISENERPPLPELTPGNWIQLSISDNGIGIPENTLPHIFDPFYTTKPVGKGTGLGLAQVYGIVKQHGGSIDVQSALGGGTTFRLFFPELPKPDEKSISSTPGSLPRGEGETILIVEDDSATREALQYLLENQNYHVYTAQNGIEALRFYDQLAQHFDLVVSDVVMPGMGGLMLYSVLREREPNLRMLFITGHPMELENQTLLEESRLNWLQKPFSMQDFIGAIRLALLNFS